MQINSILLLQIIKEKETIGQEIIIIIIIKRGNERKVDRFTGCNFTFVMKSLNNFIKLLNIDRDKFVSSFFNDFFLYYTLIFKLEINTI